MLKDRIIVINGSSSGIGRGCVEKIIDNGEIAIGLDIKESTKEHQNYRHYIVDVRERQE